MRQRAIARLLFQNPLDVVADNNKNNYLKVNINSESYIQKLQV